MRMPIYDQELRPDYINPLDVRKQAQVSRPWTLESGNSTKVSDNNSDKGDHDEE